MIKIKRLLDISKVVESHSDIVHDESRFLNTTLKSVFFGSDLIDWLIKHHNPLNIEDREGLRKLIHEELCDPTLPNQAIYPVLHEQGFLDSKKHLYRFINDQYIEYKKDAHVINLHGLETAHHKYFYEDESSSIFDTIKEFNEVVSNLFKEFVEEDGTVVNYEEILESELFHNQYVPLSTRLAFADFTSIIGNDDFMKTFFINLYNIFAIHILVTRYSFKKKWGMNMVERLDSFNAYKYNLGGHNYSLNDIHHGILRKNDPAAGNIATVVVQMIITKKSKDLRFSESDPRYKFIVRSFDPRVNFALNYGAKSCPPLRFYHDDKINDQLEEATKEYCTREVELGEEKGKMRIVMGQLFKYLSADFGKNSKEVLEFVLHYNQNDKYAKAIQKIFEQKNLPLDYKKFNLDLNMKKNE